MSLLQNTWNNANLIKVLEENGIAIMPTDTLYGIVGKALNKSVVKRIYTLKRRTPEKPCIILINDIDQLNKFSIPISKEQKSALQKYWPASAKASAGRPEPVSIILDCIDDSLTYLHRGTKTLAFRIPAQVGMQKLLKKTGPIIAPSANPEGSPPAEDIAEAKNYFGISVDLYVDGGKITGKASKVIKLNKDGTASILRK